MNILDFIMNGGVVKTSAGHVVTLVNVLPEQKFGIKGEVNWANGHKSEFEWDEDGYPEDRRTHHCLNLVPVIPVTTYHSISNKLLEKYDSYESLYVNETKRIKDASAKS